MKRLLPLLLIFASCEKEDCYLCEKDGRTYRFCEDSYYSPSNTFDEQIESMKSNGYYCDYYKD